MSLARFLLNLGSIFYNKKQNNAKSCRIFYDALLYKQASKLEGAARDAERNRGREEASKGGRKKRGRKGGRETRGSREERKRRSEEEEEEEEEEKMRG